MGIRYGLLSLDRISRRIDEGLIKRIYVDGWNRCFLNKIIELFEDKVEIYEIHMHKNFIDRIVFENTDCILFSDLFIKSYKQYSSLIQKAKAEGVFIKILSEDIYNVSNQHTIDKLKNDNKDFKIVTRNEYALARLKDGYNNIQMQDTWNSISKGHNFVLKRGDMYYSVDYLNRVLD